MPSIVITAALKTELKYLHPIFKGNRDIKLLLTGVGKVKTLQILNDCFQKASFDYLLNIGTAGAISPDIPVNTILLPEITIDNGSLEQLPVDSEFRKRIQEQLAGKDIPFIQGIQVTVKKGIKSREDRELLRGRTDGMAVDMESHFVNSWASSVGIPVAILRIVTDDADEDAMKDFQRNLHRASRHLAKILEQLDLY